jgi:NitT/TauT family transport system substrate-binding protein
MTMRRLAALLVGATLVISVAACADDTPTPPSTPGAPDEVKVGVIPIVDVAPIYLGKEKGFFTEENISLTLEAGQGGAAILPGVLSGDFQFGFSNSPSVLVANTNAGGQLKIVAPGNSTSGNPNNDFSGLVVKDPALTPKDLAGKKVATNTLKNIVEFSIRGLVQADGGDPLAVQPVEMAFPDMIAALDNDQVDAIFVVEPFLSAAKAKGWTVIGSFATLNPAQTVALYVTSTALIAENPDLVTRFTRALKKSLEYANSHPDEVRAIMGSYTQITEEVRANLTLPTWPSEVNMDSLNTFADVISAYGITPTRPDPSALVQ